MGVEVFYVEQIGKTWRVLDDDMDEVTQLEIESAGGKEASLKTAIPLLHSCLIDEGEADYPIIIPLPTNTYGV